MGATLWRLVSVLEKTPFNIKFMTLRQKWTPPDRQGVVCPIGHKSVHHLPLSCPAAAEASHPNIIIAQLYLLPCSGFPEMLTAERRPECEGEGPQYQLPRHPVSAATMVSDAQVLWKGWNHGASSCCSVQEEQETGVLVDQQRKDNLVGML